MVYRIRYRTRTSPSDVEAVVEANSPAEAVVLFRCTAISDKGPGAGEEITSVQPDETACLN